MAPTIRTASNPSDTQVIPSGHTIGGMRVLAGRRRAIALGGDPSAAKDKKPKQDPALKNLPITELSADEAIFHALNRLAYGPRPGDVERVRQMGLAKWIDQQLNPNSIDDKALEGRLADYPTLKMSTAKLIEEYPQPKQAEKEAAKRAQAQLEQEQQRRSDAAAAIVAKDMQPAPAAKDTSASEENAPTAPAASDGGAADVPSPMKEDPAMENPGGKGAGKRNALGGGDPNNVPRAIAEDSKRPQRVVAELAMAKMTRAIYSERQLQQVMDDFWFNHLNVFAGKGEDRYYLTAYERDVIQPHTLGKFKDLLTASAKSPAMLFYLDNFLSADPRAAQRLAAERAMRQQGRYGGYGRRFRLPPTRAAEKAKRTRVERKLWPRIDGIAHTGRGWRVHAERCDGGRAVLHRLDHREAAPESSIQI